MTPGGERFEGSFVQVFHIKGDPGQRGWIHTENDALADEFFSRLVATPGEIVNLTEEESVEV